MEIAKNFEYQTAETKWYQYWTEKGFFHSEPDHRKPFTIVIPPPNVTGMLHMGHVMNNTIQDVLIRRARMMGFNACWVPGTDHASIATETKVVNKLAAEGITKDSLTREAFLEHAWEWTEKYGGIILDQLKKLGSSCDWERTKFTMDKDMSESVIKVFVDLYKKGYVYRGVRMVNWDPKGKTALSDEEVIYKEIQSKLYYINYKIIGEEGTITIATTRPETLLGDTAVCVHPNDTRFTHLQGKKVLVPFVNREIPIIADEYVDMEFGTGCLKITPAHDINDYELGIKYQLPVIDILNNDGTLSPKANYLVGIDRFEARKQIVEDLKELGQLVKIEELINKVGFSERTDAVIEPKLSMQWFCKMQEMAKPALENVMNDQIKIHPPKFKNMYRSWMENIKDWCISRQLWWGHQIPAYYLPNGQYVIAETAAEALKQAQQLDASITDKDLTQDPDVLDTWFSSWLWPIAVFDGIRHPGNKEIEYYYPTNDLVTGFDIIFFWVARMIMSGYEYEKDFPFENIYITGMVRDNQGRKMSKQLGNSPDPLDLIKKYGADGVRVGMLLCSPAGNDLLFNEDLCEQGRNFGNKIWNSFRLINMWEIDNQIPQPKHSELAIQWFETKFNETLLTINDHFSKYRISDALMATYRLFWDDFCSWYLEIIKPEYQKPIDKKTHQSTVQIMEKLMQILHPFMPFISEEVWHLMNPRSEKDCIIVSSWPKETSFNSTVLEKFEIAKEIIIGIRNIRKEKNIPNKDSLQLSVKTNHPMEHQEMDSIIKKLGNIDDISYINEQLDNSFGFVVKSNEYYIPVSDKIDIEAEKEKIRKELEHTKGFLNSVMKKLENVRFVNSAPNEVVAIEKKKQADAEAKIKALQDQLSNL